MNVQQQQLLRQALEIVEAIANQQSALLSEKAASAQVVNPGPVGCGTMIAMACEYETLETIGREMHRLLRDSRPASPQLPRINATV